MLTMMNTERPKTNHFRNEAVLVDQKKLNDHTNLMRAGRSVSNFILKR